MKKDLVKEFYKKKNNDFTNLSRLETQYKTNQPKWPIIP
jgi:hypothetical protein